MGSEILTKKRRTRAGHRASATRTIAQIEDLVKAEKPNISGLTLLRLTLKEKYDTIKTLDAEIIELIDDEAGLTEEIERADGYKEGIFASLIKADQLLESPTATPVTLRGITATATTPVGRTKSVSLPKLQLRHFNVDLTKWTSFWESFEAAVDKNSDLSGVEKFNYLSSLLEGTAKEAVSGLSLTEANYAEAVSMLKKRFGST